MEEIRKAIVERLESKKSMLRHAESSLLEAQERVTFWQERRAHLNLSIIELEDFLSGTVMSEVRQIDSYRQSVATIDAPEGEQ